MSEKQSDFDAFSEIIVSFNVGCLQSPKIEEQIRIRL